MRNIILIFVFLLSWQSAFSKGFFRKNYQHYIKAFGPDFVASCSIGLINGCKVIRKFGVNNNLTLNVKRDIWDYGASDKGNVDYTYPQDGTAPIDTLSSSSALDSQLIVLYGLDATGNDVTQTATLNGQNKVTLSTSLWRIYRIQNLDTQTTADRSIGFNGDIYVYEDTAITAGVPNDATKVRAFVSDGDNQTQMSQYTVPKGWTGFFYGGSIKTSKKQAASIVFQTWVRTYGSVFRLTDTNALNTSGSGNYTSSSYVPLSFPELADVVVCAESDTSTVGVAVAYNLVLLDNEVWGL